MDLQDSNSSSSMISTSALECFVDKLRTERNRSSTRKIYYSVWKQFNEFFIKLDIKPKTWEERLILFVGYLVEQNKKSTTIRSYISVVKVVLREDQVEINEDRYLLSSLTKACKYRNDHVRIRLPIQRGLLQILLAQALQLFDNQPYLSSLYQAMFAAAYYGLLRIGEVTTGDHPIKAFDVHVTDNKNKILFILRTSKTHWTDIKPQQIRISSTNRWKQNLKHCPFRILQEFLRMRPHGCIDKMEPFFIFSDRTPVTSDNVRRTLKKLLNLLGLEETLYNFHSLRIGCAVDLYHNLHIPVESIKKIGRWHSNSVYSYLS